jgi:hypothetical protein
LGAEVDNSQCCYTVQDKVWVRDRGNEPWEVSSVKADADTFATATEGANAAAANRTTPRQRKPTTASGAAGGCC